MPIPFNHPRSNFGHRFSICAWFASVSLIGLLPLRAEVGEGSSSSTPLTLNVSSTVSLTALVVPVSATTTILATPVPSVSGTAPGAYSVSGSPTNYTSPTEGVNLSSSLLGTDVDVTAGTLAIGATVLSNSASSTVDGGPGLQTTTATAGVTSLDVGFGVLSAIVDPPLASPIGIDTYALRITTGVITATSSVTGDDFQEASFSSSVADFNLSLFGVSLLYLAPSLAADLAVGNPVSVVIELDDLTIELPAGLSNLSVSGSILVSNYGSAEDGLLEGEAFSSALTLGFQNISISASVGGVITVETNVNGTLSVADTSAIQTVPEPSTTLLLAGALTFLVTRRRR